GEAQAAEAQAAEAQAGEAQAAEAQAAAEYELLRSRCGLVDRSARGRLALTGADAAEFLNGQVTNEIVALPPGTGCYAAFLTHKGKMLGDLRVLAAGDAQLLLETERVALQALFDMIARFKVGHDVELHKRTLESSLLSLIGPRAREVLARGSGDAQPPPEREHAHVATEIAGRAVRAIATAAPDGIDVLCEHGDRDAVLGRLLEAGAEVVSDQAAEILRIERGRPRYGIDLDGSVIPQEAGINDRAVSFTKGCYVGQETVARLHYRGRPNRHLRGLELAQPVSAGTPLLLGDREVGTLTSVALSPRLGPIGLALVRREAELGTTLRAGETGPAATLVRLPFGG
ncbi:MAG: CAF17-like 4Fe-4S cluster assembly/insertion protein YgfZ, partial [Solirubrobacteraceae bacterium]